MVAADWKGLEGAVWKGLDACGAAVGSLEPNTLLSDRSELADEAAVSKEGVAKRDVVDEVRAGCVGGAPNEMLGVAEAKAANGLATAEADGAGKAAAKEEADEEPKAVVEEREDGSLSADVRPDSPKVSSALLGEEKEKEVVGAEEDGAAKGEANDDVVAAAPLSDGPKPNDGAVEADGASADDVAAGLASAFAGVLFAATDCEAGDEREEEDEEAEADVEVGGAEKEKDGAAADVEKEKEGVAAEVENVKEGAAAAVEKENGGAAAEMVEGDVAGAVEELLVTDVVDAALLAAVAAADNDDVLGADGENCPAAVAGAAAGLTAVGAAVVVAGAVAGLAGLEETGTGSVGGGDMVNGFRFVRLGDSGNTTPDALVDGAAAAEVAAAALDATV